VRVRLLLRGVAHDIQSLFGSLRVCLLHLRLVIGAVFVHDLFVRLSAEFDQLGGSRHTKLSPTYELSVLRHRRLIFEDLLLLGRHFHT
jgi:hypothetical protein